MMVVMTTTAVNCLANWFLCVPKSEFQGWDENIEPYEWREYVKEMGEMCDGDHGMSQVGQVD